MGAGEVEDGSDDDPACLLLSLRLGLYSNALDDSQVAYRLAKGIVLPTDREKFTKKHDKATLCSSSLVRWAYEVLISYLYDLGFHFFAWFAHHLSFCALVFLLCVGHAEHYCYGGEV